VLGIHVDIRLSNQKVVFSDYDLLHFFNITRPADILNHLEFGGKKQQLQFSGHTASRQTGPAIVVSPIFVEYEEYDQNHRKGISGTLLQIAPNGEYVKTIGRMLVSGEKIVSKSYLWTGQIRSIQKILDRASCLLPNSESEMNRLRKKFQISCPYNVVPNVIDPETFESGSLRPLRHVQNNIILSVARIEGIKNQLNLIKAIANTNYKLYLVGAPATHQKKYYDECRKAAGHNVIFIDHLSQEELIPYYRKAKVHVLPSWFETTGLSSLEAAAMGCNIVISNKGDAHEYFGEHAHYCDPLSPVSILNAIDKASSSPIDPLLIDRIYNNYTWKRAAELTAEAYQNVLAYEDRNTRNKRHPESIRRI
jgi:glycosyltransferase involved in cell wall biosynthesis